MDENKLLLAGLADKYHRFEQCNYLVSTDFLNLSQQATARNFLNSHGDGRGFLYGGYENAERRQVLFVPEYMDVSDEQGLISWFQQNPEDCPLVVLQLSYGGGGLSKTLTHRDYLGSLLGEGIRREKVGDILVEEHGAQVLVMRELADYLAAHYGKAGRTSLNVEILPISAVKAANSARETVKFTVSSPRLDTIVSAVFRVSRRDAVSAIAQGRVFVNEAEAFKPDYNLKEGEKVVLRGKGKAIYLGVSGTSKKGKLYVTMEKFV